MTLFKHFASRLAHPPNTAYLCVPATMSYACSSASSERNTAGSFSPGSCSCIHKYRWTGEPCERPICLGSGNTSCGEVNRSLKHCGGIPSVEAQYRQPKIRPSYVAAYVAASRPIKIPGWF